MRSLRALIRLTGLVLVTVGCWVPFALGKRFLIVTGRSWRSWRSFWFRAWGRGALAVLRIRRTVHGKAFEVPFVAVCNHVSYLDIPLLAAELDVVFLAKSEVGSWPFVGFLCRSIDTMFIERGTNRDVIRVSRAIVERVRAGQGVLVFPEATSSDGRDVLAFRSSLLQAPVELVLEEIGWASISYRSDDAAMPAEDCIAWWSDESFATHVWRFMKISGCEASVTFGSVGVEGISRKEIASRLHGRVREALLESSRRRPVSE